MITENNIEVYRSGDFAKKADYMSQMSGRSTGYFGTGYYFCTRPEYCAPQGNGKRPIYKMTLKNGLKLCYGTIKIHDTLKLIQRFLVNYPSLIDSEALKKKLDFAGWAEDYFTEDSTLGERLKDEFECWGEDYDDWQDYLSHDYGLKRLLEKASAIPELATLVDEFSSDLPDWDKLIDLQNNNSDLFESGRLRELKNLRSEAIFSALLNFGLSEEKFLDIAKKIYEANIEYYCDEGYFKMYSRGLECMDSFPTQFLKLLGYDGIFPAKECDNTTYGGVIYDLQNFEYKLISENGLYFNNLSESRNRLNETSVNKILSSKLYHGSRNGELTPNEDHKYNCFYITPNFAYAAMYSEDENSEHGCVFQVEPREQLQIFDASNEQDFQRLKTYVETNFSDNPDYNIKLINWNIVKHGDWSTACNRNDYFRDDVLLESVKNLGYDGYINIEWDEDIPSLYADGMGGAALVVNSVSIGIFNIDLLDFTDTFYYDDYSDFDSFNECYDADANYLSEIINDFPSMSSLKEFAANNLPFLDIDSVIDIVESYSDFESLQESKGLKLKENTLDRFVTRLSDNLSSSKNVNYQRAANQINKAYENCRLKSFEDIDKILKKNSIQKSANSLI